MNLRENILPTRERAHLILDKGGDARGGEGAAAEAVTRGLRRAGYRLKATGQFGDGVLRSGDVVVSIAPAHRPRP